MSRKKKKDHDEHIDESWLIPYADILTLLLALFIVLFSMSSIDAKKFQALSQSFNEAFSSGTGIFEFPSPMPDEEAQSFNEQDEKQIEKEKGEGEQEQNQTEEDKKNSAEKADKLELQLIQSKVNTYIQDKNLTDKLETSLTDEGLLVSIRDNVLFESGSAEVRAEDLLIANEISELLIMNPPRNIIISGHTDNVPIRNAQFESNWELSVMRAINFMKIVLKNEQLDPSWFSAKGYGEFRPLESNDTAAGREKNRRVEILILPRSAED